jgi:hypothetical protein
MTPNDSIRPFSEPYNPIRKLYFEKEKLFDVVCDLLEDP